MENKILPEALEYWKNPSLLNIEKAHKAIIKELFGSLSEYKKVSDLPHGFDLKYTPSVFREPTAEEAIEWAKNVLTYDGDSIDLSGEVERSIYGNIPYNNPSDALSEWDIEPFRTMAKLELLYDGKPLYEFEEMRFIVGKDNLSASFLKPDSWCLVSLDKDLLDSIVEVLPFSLEVVVGYDGCGMARHKEDNGVMLYSGFDIMSYWSRVMFSRVNRSFISSARAKVRRNARKVAMYRRFVAKSPVGGRAVAENKRKK